jgi:hypothetical protein
LDRPSLQARRAPLLRQRPAATSSPRSSSTARRRGRRLVHLRRRVGFRRSNATRKNLNSRGRGASSRTGPRRVVNISTMYGFPARQLGRHSRRWTGSATCRRRRSSRTLLPSGSFPAATSGRRGRGFRTRAARREHGVRYHDMPAGTPTYPGRR